jgi:hypothetical protein
MSEITSDKQVRERCENLNRRMEARGVRVRYEVSRRYGAHPIYQESERV